jgi:DNA polymerase III subunit alpha
MSFTHLEVHSNLTLLGATPSPDALAARAASEGMTHLALTDTNALYAAVAFAKACKKASIQPIIGMAVNLQRPANGPLSLASSDAGPGRLVLLAKDAAGYRSLCRLSTLIQGRPDHEAVAETGLAWEQIAAHRAGLICLSGGRQGWVDRFLEAGEPGAAHAFAARLAGTFDEDACLALEMDGPQDAARAAELAGLARRLGMPLVAVRPVYCLAPDDAPRLRLLAAIRANRPLDAAPEVEEAIDGEDDADAEPVMWRDSSVGEAARPGYAARPAVPVGQEDTPRHWLTEAEMAPRYVGYGHAIRATAEIAARCGPALPDGRPLWPSLVLPRGQTPAEGLAELARAGLSERYPENPPVARLEKELASIGHHGFAPLFLVVADIVRFARGHGVPVSTRGSVANSLVAYCSGITTVDPIEHDLLFERFLNPARRDPPDIDLDFCSARRDEVLRYVRDHYGPDHVAMVCTISTMRPQSAVREVGKAYGLDDGAIGRLAGMMPGRWHPDPRRRDERTVDDILPEIKDAREREVAKAAWDLVGTPDHISIHPGGVVISPGPMTDIAPLQWTPKGFLVTQYEHGDVAAIGLPKLDLLGIRALTVLADAAEMVRANRDPNFELSVIPLDDEPTGDLISRAETIGVFQCESEGAQRTLRKLKARHVRDLAIANAFFKPGPAMGGQADVFVKRYRGEQQTTYLHPALAPILGRTKGVLIFQEQVLRIATEVAGLSWEQADHLRRGMSHFGRHEIAALQEQFVQGCSRPAPEGPGMSPATAEQLWEQILPFSGYGFNQGHATAYADVSYRCAYLKTHYPAEFLAARLQDWGGFHHPAIYMSEAVRLGVAVRPPHVNFSGTKFTLVPAQKPGFSERAGFLGELYMGLGQVRDLRNSAAAAIAAGRARGPYLDLRDLLSRVELQPKELDHLIRCGALDGLGDTAGRSELLAEAELLRRRGGIHQLSFDFARPQPPPEPLARRWEWEQELLGLPVSALADPLALVRGDLPPHAPLAEVVASRSKLLLTAGVRLPGWTGGPGFFLGDGERFVFVHVPKGLRSPAPWKPVLVSGRWTADEYGVAWLQAAQVSPAADRKK